MHYACCRRSWYSGGLCGGCGSDPPSVLRNSHSTVHNLGRLDRSPGWNDFASAFAYMPGNESLRLEISEKTLEIERLPERLKGLSIAHVSDLHFTGRIGKGYFERAIELTNDLQADLVAVTGDLVESEDCFSWIEDTLARLSARHGVFFVLGNHDLRTDPQRLRRMLVDAGQIDLGGSWQIIEIEGERVLLAGNELPWFTPAADLSGSPPAALRDPAVPIPPDQIDYARRPRFRSDAGRAHAWRAGATAMAPGRSSPPAATA